MTGSENVIEQDTNHSGMASQHRNKVIEYLSQNKADGVTLIVSLILFHLMLVMGSIQIINRYLDIPFSVYWAGEVTRTAMVFLTLMLVPYLFVHQLDISFLPVLKQIFGSHLEAVLLIRNLVLVVFSSLMVWSSYLSYIQSDAVTLPTVGWFLVRWVYLFMGLAFAVLLVYVLIDTKRKVFVALGRAESEDSADV